MDQLVGVTGHGLGLSNQAHRLVINTEAVIYIGASDMKYDRLSHLGLCCTDFPVPLVSLRLDMQRLFSDRRRGGIRQVH